jgi:nucleotide-binding universal stress UspA family protein
MTDRIVWDNQPVVLGYADDRVGDAALTIAVNEARLRDTSLTIIHQLVGTEVTERYGRYASSIDTRRASEYRLVCKVNDIAPDFASFDIRVVARAIGDELVAASRVSSLIVLGVSTKHAVTAAAFDTVPRELVRRSRCPVLLIPANCDEWAGAPLICGIDRSEASTQALRWAAEEADRRGVIVQAVEILATKPSRLLDANDPDSLQSWVRARVPFAAATVLCSVEVAHAKHRLIEMTSEAHGLLVIGAHERSAWRPASIARTLTAQTRVPVVVVPRCGVDQTAEDSVLEQRTQSAPIITAAGGARVVGGTPVAAGNPT